MKLQTIFEPILNFLFPAHEDVSDIESLTHFLPQSSSIGTSIHCLFAYQDEKVKHLVWEIKYYRNNKIADHVGALLAKKIKEKTDTEKYILIPIPLTFQRLKERGFNHTELIAQATMNHLPSNFSLTNQAVQKTKHTPKQNSIEDREERFRNIKDAFRVTNRELVENQNIILVDDVVTTGATLNEVKKVLKYAGARSVTSFAIAH